MSNGIEVAVASSARSLYGKLLAIIPNLAILTHGAEVSRFEGDAVSLAILGRCDFFRRVSITQLEQGEFDNELIRAPYVEFVLRVDLQCAQIVSYENPIVSQFFYRIETEQPWARSERLVCALTNAFLNELLAAESTFCKSQLHRLHKDG